MMALYLPFDQSLQWPRFPLSAQCPPFDQSLQWPRYAQLGQSGPKKHQSVRSALSLRSHLTDRYLQLVPCHPLSQSRQLVPWAR